MGSIAAGALLVFIPGILGLGLHFRRAMSAATVVRAYGLVFVLVLAASLNFELGIVGQKVASTVAFEVFTGSPGSEAQDTFLFHSLLNAIPFALTGHWWAAIGTNCALVALIYAYARTRHRAASLYVLGPAVLNFALFALRDIAIGFVMFVLGYLVVLPVTRRTRALEGGGLLALVISRPENAIIYVLARLSMAGSSFSFKATWNRQRTRHSRTVRRLFGVVAVAALLILAPAALGLEVETNPARVPATIEGFFESRATRAAPGAGGGSNILGGTLAGMPFFTRFPIQVAAFFVLPFPFEVRSLDMLLALADSVVFCLLTLRFVRSAPTPGIRFLVVYVLAVAAFASNYGNLLRLRMPAYFLMAGVLVAQGAVQHRESLTAADTTSSGR